MIKAPKKLIECALPLDEINAAAYPRPRESLAISLRATHPGSISRLLL